MISTKEKSEIIKIINDIKVEDLVPSKLSKYSENLKEEFGKMSEDCDEHTKKAFSELRSFITISLYSKMYENGIGRFLDQKERKVGLKKLEKGRLKQVLNQVKKSDELEDMAGKIELAFKSKIKEFGNIK